MRKKIFTFLLALVAGIGSSWAQNPSGSCGTDLTWEFDPSTGVLAISGTGTTMTSIGWVSGVWNEQVTSVTFPESLTSIEVMSAFQGFGMSTITLPENLTELGYAAFDACAALTSIEIPAGVSTIQGSTFSRCSSLATVKLPASITSIYDYAFADCPALTSFYSYAETPPTCESNKVFWDQYEWKPLDLSAATLYVPYSSIADYEAANGWKDFGTIAAIPGTEPTPSVTAARFVYNYDCQRNPAYPQKGSPCTLRGFKDPYVGYNGIGRDVKNTSFGPWKLEFVAFYTPSNDYGCQSVVSEAVNQYYLSLSNNEKDAKCLEVPIFRLWQYNIVAGEYQPAAYGIVCAYAAEGNAEDHAALFISAEGDYGCFLAGKQHNEQISLSCENDLTTGLNDLVAAASATDPYYDVVWPVILSIDAIGTVELTQHCKDFIEGSRAAYDALTDEQKAQITNYSTLTDAETQWASLVAEAKPYADAVVDLINAIPNPVVYTQECKDAIDAAQNAYNALTDGQKMFVSNYETLKNAPSDLINAAPYVHILFKANGNEKKVENVTLPKEFTEAEMTTMLKELYGVEGDYDMYAYTNADAVNIIYRGEWTISPFMGTVNVGGGLEKYDPEIGFDHISLSLEITLELPPFGPAPTPTDEQVATNEDPENPGTYYYSTFFHGTQNYALTGDGTQAFIATLSNNDLVLTKIAEGTQVIPANTAVIFRKSGSADPVVLNPTEENGVSVNPDDNSLLGVDEVTAAPANCYVLSGTNEYGVGFYRINSENLKAHKAYVIYTGSAAPKRMRFVFNQTTDVESIQPSAVSIQKILENGQVIIIRNGVRYNAAGQIVK